MKATKSAAEDLAAIGLLALVFWISFGGTTLLCAAKNWLDDYQTFVCGR